MNGQVETLAAYFQLMNHNGAAHVYREAQRSGLLDALGAGEVTAAELAARRGCDRRATELLLDVLEVLRLVTSAEGRYSLTFLAQLLLGGSYRQLGDPYWSHLPSFVQSGEPLVKMDDAAQSESHYQAQAAALAWMLGPAAELAAELLDEHLAADAAILDVGAGSAIWSLCLARRAAGRRVTAVDWPSVLEVAADYARQFELADRFEQIAGNFHEVEIPRCAFDLAILANVTHLETPSGNASLFGKARQALRPGGRLVIIDVFSGLPEGDLNRTLYALGLALRTDHGHVYTWAELEKLLREAGFAAVKVVHLSTPPHVLGLLMAQMPL